VAAQAPERIIETNEAKQELERAKEEFDQAQLNFTLAQVALEEAKKVRDQKVLPLKKAELEAAYARGRELEEQERRATADYGHAEREIQEWIHSKDVASRALQRAKDAALPEFPTQKQRQDRKELIARLEAACDELGTECEFAGQYAAAKQELLILDQQLQGIRYTIRNLEAVVSGQRIGQFV
jgi:hypothetical protein